MDTDLARTFSRRLARRDFLRYSGVALGAGVLAACQRDTAGPAQTSPRSSPVGTLEDEPGGLQVFEWSGFELEELWEPYKEAVPDPDPQYTFMTAPDQALARIAGGFQTDLVHPELSFLQDFVDLGQFQEWDTSRIENFSELNPALVGAGQIDGRQYAIPLDWGFVSALYRADEVEPEEDSFAILWDERYAGRISWHDHPWMLAIAGYVEGVSNPWDMSDEELEEIKNLMIDRKRLIRNLWVSTTDMYQDIVSGSVWITYAWPDALVATRAEGVDTVYMFPKEGAISWVEGFILSAETENFLHAHEYANAWASEQTGRWLMENYAYGHSNTNIDTSGIDPELLEVFHVDDPAFLEEPNSHIAQYMPRRDLYTRIWDEVKAA